MLTESTVVTQTPLLRVQVRMVSPTSMPLTVVLGLAGSATLPLPCTMFQAPNAAPTGGVAVMVALSSGEHNS